jgi:hypothetical protein
VEKGERYSLAQTVQERITIPARALLMRLVIELDRANDREVAFVAQQEIEVLGLNTIALDGPPTRFNMAATTVRRSSTIIIATDEVIYAPYR